MPKKPGAPVPGGNTSPNITADYEDGRSTTRVSSRVAPVITPDNAARLQLEALLGGEKKTGYRSVQPSYAPPPSMPTYSQTRPYSNPTATNNDYDLASRRAAYLAQRAANVPPPDKYIEFPQPTGYGIYIARELNPEYEMWYENKFGRPYGEGNVEVAPSPPPLYGAANYDMAAAPPSPPAAPGGGAGMPSWYDMPEWQRTQILSQQLYGGPVPAQGGRAAVGGG